jgi:hypothetical protein
VIIVRGNTQKTLGAVERIAGKPHKGCNPAIPLIDLPAPTPPQPGLGLVVSVIGIYQQLRIIWAKGAQYYKDCATAYRIELLIESPIMVFPLADSAVGDGFGIVHTMVDRL